MDMSVVTNFIWEWRWLLIVLAVGVVYCVAEWNNVKARAYKAMLQAKDLAKDKILHGGEAQREWAVNHIMKLMPMRLKLLLGESTVRVIVEFLYRQAIDYLDDGNINDSIKDEDSKN